MVPLGVVLATADVTTVVIFCIFLNHLGSSPCLDDGWAVRHHRRRLFLKTSELKSLQIVWLVFVPDDVRKKQLIEFDYYWLYMNIVPIGCF